MSSWQLFKHLTPFHASDLEYTPVFRRARQQTRSGRSSPCPLAIRQISLIVVGADQRWCICWRWCSSRTRSPSTA